MNVRIQYTSNFVAAVSYEGQLIMNNYFVRFWLNTNTTDNENHTIAFERLKYFLNVVENGVFIDETEVDMIQNYLRAGMKVTTLPGTPVDQLIGIMLFHKLNSIMEDRISVLETEISSSLTEGITYMHSENENIDIDIPEWWLAPDLVHCDIDIEDAENVVNLHRVGAWRDIELSWPDESVEETGNVTTDNTVVFADFGKDKNED